MSKHLPLLLKDDLDNEVLQENVKQLASLMLTTIAKIKEINEEKYSQTFYELMEADKDLSWMENIEDENKKKGLFFL